MYKERIVNFCSISQLLGLHPGIFLAKALYFFNNKGKSISLSISLFVRVCFFTRGFVRYRLVLFLRRLIVLISHRFVHFETMLAPFSGI